MINYKRLLCICMIVFMISNMIGCEKTHRPTHDYSWQYGEDIAKIEGDGEISDQRYVNHNCGFAFTAPESFQLWGEDGVYEYFASSNNTTVDSLKTSYHNKATGLIAGCFWSDGADQAEVAYFSVIPSVLVDELDDSSVNKTVRDYFEGLGMVDGITVTLEDTVTNEINGVKIYETLFDSTEDDLNLNGCLSIFTYDELYFTFYDVSTSDVTKVNSDVYQFEFLK